MHFWMRATKWRISVGPLELWQSFHNSQMSPEPLSVPGSHQIDHGSKWCMRCVLPMFQLKVIIFAGFAKVISHDPRTIAFWDCNRDIAKLDITGGRGNPTRDSDKKTKLKVGQISDHLGSHASRHRESLLLIVANDGNLMRADFSSGIDHVLASNPWSHFIGLFIQHRDSCPEFHLQGAKPDDGALVEWVRGTHSVDSMEAFA